MITKDSRNILLADDSLFFRTKLSEVLNEAGHRVSFAKDGSEAINEIKNNSEGIDLLVLDLQMPHIDGLGVLKWINDNGYKGKFPVLVITGAYEPSQIIENLKDLGAAGFMSKDLPPEQVVFRVNRLLFADKATAGIPRERLPVSIPVDFTFRDNTVTGTILTISEGGVFLFTDVELLKGAMLHLKFSLPGIEKVLNIKGIVKWSPEEVEGKFILCGHGIVFASISQDDQKILKEFISNEVVKLKRILNE